ncbi:ABC transporter substrate-binding protein [Cohnella yongneupensis]|uniref:ABC transporter substrate-binding protein n=1 Tax=Cohnella yongneupensis TaxID=425006 RepID=A0ABW0R5H4_9BACL
MPFKRVSIVMLAMVMIYSLVACSGSNSDGKESAAPTESTAENTETATESAPPETEAEPEPITLKINLDWNDEDFERVWKKPVEDKFPYITLEKIPASETNIEEQVAQGNIPDIIQAQNHEHVSFLEQRGLTMDMTELMNKYQFDINRLQPGLIARAKNFGKGTIPTLPFERGVHAMYYNKDIFDKFAVDYPTDDMTWSQVIELSKQVTGTIGDIQYRGLDLDVPNMAFSQLNTNYADPETGEPLYTKEPAFVKYYDMLHEVWSIPGNLYGEDPGALIQSFGGKFIVDQNVAMLPIWNITSALATAEEQTGMQWDMVTYPVWDDLIGVDPMAQGPVIGVSAATKYPDDAFKVIAYILSDEYQAMRSREGKPSVLVSEEVNSQFAADIPALADKNLAAFFKHSPAPGPQSYHEFEHIVENTSWNMMKDFARMKADTNTHLRNVQEAAEERVENERQMK